MTDHLPNSSWLRIRDQNHVIIIGAGPVGLVSSLFLSKYQIPHLLVEKLPKPDNHPQAHFLNCRSMEILRELDGLDQAIYDRSAPVEQWRRFVYCTDLADLPALHFSKQKRTGPLLGVVDHFADVRDDPFSPARVMHFPQHDLVCLLRKAALESRFCKPLQGYRAEIKEHHSHVKVLLTDDRNGQRWHLKTQYVLAADGAHSSTRKQLGIELVSETGTLQHLINVHFFSQQLAKRLQDRIPAMLYFIYSRAGVAVLIAHSFRRGEFVAQIPFFPPYQQIEDFGMNRCAEMLQKLAGQSIDVDVRSIRNWRMGIWLASRLRSKRGRCFLIGDAAHQFTPAGGFGMNTGIQDAHNLIWKLALVIRSENSTQLRSSERLLSSYEQERKPIARLNAKMSVENYLLTLQIPKAIGLNLNLLKRLLRLMSRFPDLYPLKRCLFQWAMYLGLKQVEWLKYNSAIARQRRRTVHKIFSNAKRQTLQLLFPGQDLGLNYTTGWLFKPNMDEMDSFDPFVFTPQLKVGGRLPHFWLIDTRGQRISALDLPGRLIGADALPCHVLLKAGNLKTNLHKFDALDKHSIVEVYVSHNPPKDKYYFAYDRDRPAFLPKSYAILIRPDGHIAWLKAHASNIKEPVNAFKAADGRG